MIRQFVIISCIASKWGSDQLDCQNRPESAIQRSLFKLLLSCGWGGGRGRGEVLTHCSIPTKYPVWNLHVVIFTPRTFKVYISLHASDIWGRLHVHSMCSMRSLMLMYSQWTAVGWRCLLPSQHKWFACKINFSHNAWLRVHELAHAICDIHIDDDIRK